MISQYDCLHGDEDIISSLQNQSTLNPYEEDDAYDAWVDEECWEQQ